MSRRYMREQRERQQFSSIRLSKEGQRFEILVKPNQAFAFRLGKNEDVSQTLITETIFLDAAKGLRASEDQLRDAFGTSDQLEIASIILRKGTLQMTAEQRRQLIEEKRKQIISFISRQCIDPRSNLPHPPLRIEQAMGQIRYSIDPFGDSEEQAREVIKLLRPILPLKIEQVSVSLQIPPEEVGPLYGVIKGFGTLTREEWQSNGSLYAVIELPAGLYGPFLEKIGEKSRGNINVKLMK